MHRPSSAFAAALLLTSLSVAPAAATTFVLDNVTFNDGGTAAGSFDLNIYGYIADEPIGTTAGTVLAGYAYSSGQLIPGSPPSSAFAFYSGSGFELVLDLTAPLGGTSSGSDPLVAGGVVSGSALAGSYEQCTDSTCGGTGNYRLVTGGFTYAPEPATLSLLGFAAVALGAARRRRSRQDGGA
jgi:hypothetical protein